MLRLMVIGFDEHSREALQQALDRSGDAGVVRWVRGYPAESDLEATVRAAGPDAVFCGVADRGAALGIRKRLLESFPGLPFVAFHDHCDSQLLLDLMRLGIREFLPLPADGRTVSDLIVRLRAHCERSPSAVPSTDFVLAFLPSKPGVGASTLALNVSLALAERLDGGVLLADLDWHAGILAFMLNDRSPADVHELYQRAGEIDEDLWSRATARPHPSLDLIPALRPSPETRIDPEQVRRLIAFARRNYRAVVLDLSGNMEMFSIDALAQSLRVLLVCTAELPSIHLAQTKLDLLRRRGLHEKVEVLLNRSGKQNAISQKQIEHLIGWPVAAELPNDYLSVHRALAHARAVDAASSLGRSVAAFTEKVCRESGMDLPLAPGSGSAPEADLERFRMGGLWPLASRLFESRASRENGARQAAPAEPPWAK